MKMTLWIHSTILAAALAASTAVGIAGASYVDAANEPAAKKADRLPLVEESDASYVTIETRQDGVSVLKRIPL
jgi:hypothetical protein